VFCLTMLILFKIKDGDFTLDGEGAAYTTCVALCVVGVLFFLKSAVIPGVSYCIGKNPELSAALDEKYKKRKSGNAAADTSKAAVDSAKKVSVAQSQPVAKKEKTAKSATPTKSAKPLADSDAAETKTKKALEQTAAASEPNTAQSNRTASNNTTGEIVDWARGSYSGGIIVDANSITGNNINITGARTIIQKPLSGHPNLKWAYIYVGNKKYGVVWDRTTYTNSGFDGIELGIGSYARSAFDFYSGSDKDAIFANIAREAPVVKVVKDR